MSDDVLTFTYTNWRGETAERRVRASSARFTFGATEWHPEPQWLLTAVDLDKNAGRDFAVRDIRFAADPVLTRGGYSVVSSIAVVHAHVLSCAQASADTEGGVAWETGSILADYARGQIDADDAIAALTEDIAEDKEPDQ